MPLAPKGMSQVACDSTFFTDQQDQSVYYFFEVYRDEAALEAHRAAPHYAVWRAATDTLYGPPEATRCDTVIPAAAGYWDKRVYLRAKAC